MEINSSRAQTEILIVEDSLVEAELLRRILVKAGYLVKLAKNGKDGLQTLREHPCALVISDVQMPHMDGYEMCREIKHDEKLWNIPVILESVLSEPEDIIKALNAGADSYLTKPCVEVNLLARIRSLLSIPLNRSSSEVRRAEQVEYNGKHHTITADSRQALNLLLSVYENTLSQNQELVSIQTQLNLLNDNLEGQVQERTAALRESEARYKRITDGLTDYQYTVRIENGQAVETTQSPACLTVTGYKVEEFAANQTLWIQMVAPDDRELVRENVRQILAGKDVPPMEHRIIRKDGDIRWVSDTTILFKDATGKLLSYDGVIKDITELKHAEDERHIASQYSRSLIEASLDPLVTISADGKITDVNEATVLVTGVARNTLINSDFSEFFLEPDKARAGYQEVFAKGFVTDYPLSIRHVSGKVTDVLYNASVFRDGRGKVLGVFAAARDITERKRQEAMLHFRLKLIEMTSQVDHLQLMQSTLDIAEDLTGSTIGFFHYVEQDQENISLQTWSTNTLENMCKAEGAGQHYPVSQAGVWADAIRTRATVIQNDYPHLESKKGMPEGHAVVERFVSIPIIRNEKVVALIGVGNKSSDYVVADAETVSQLANLVFDLIEANKVQQALRESEEKFRKITESAQDAVIMMGADECITAWNFAAERFFGYSAAEAIGQELHPLIAPHDAQIAFKHGFQHFLQTGTGPIIGKVSEVIACRKGGEAFPVEVSLSSLQIGGQWHAIGIFRDITERKHAEANLRITASVFDNSQEAILITDANNAIMDVNPAFTKITGYTREEVTGKNPRVLSSGRQDKAFYAAMWESLKLEKAWRGEIWNRRKSGETYAELLAISVICDDDGKVLRYVGVFSDISHFKEHEAELSRVAHYDALTGIPNRVLLADRMRQAIAQTAREQNMMAVCYFDLDAFKPINDTMGHDAGDQVLIEVAKRIGNTIRGGDTVARLGGDEFVALLLGLEKGEECVATLERLHSAIVQPITINNKPVIMSASIGVSVYPLDDEDPDTLLRHADQAMYVSKQSGKNRFHIYDPALDRRARDQHELLKSIHYGLEHGQFELHYQPKINLRSKEMVGAEALIRWRHPERGLLLPAEFLRHIENTDLDIEIGEWVTATALAQMDHWKNAGLDIEVSINISGYHLESSGFVEKLKQQLAIYPDMLQGKFQIEVLETVALNDIAIVRGIIESCRKVGVGFALDDFGTGYSSLSYLSGLPVDVLKIDHSFIRDMLEDKGDMAIVQGIIALARAFERQTVAEGIETDEHYKVLLDMGCELGQGYGIACPMPASEIPKWRKA